MNLRPAFGPPTWPIDRYAPGSGATDGRLFGRWSFLPRCRCRRSDPRCTCGSTPYGRGRSVWLDRWGNVGRPGHGYVPFGGEVTEERRFGDVVILSQVTIGWWFGTPRYAPLFEATLRDARPVD